MNFIEDNNLHVWSTSSYLGDQMFNLAGALHLMKAEGKEGVVIHTGRQSWSPLVQGWHPARPEILKLWSAIDFVKGVLYDVEQDTYIEQSCDESLYDVKILTQHVEYNSDNYRLSDHLLQLLLPSFLPSLPANLRSEDVKVAVFHPLSLTNRLEESKAKYVSQWDSCIESLLQKNYHIYMIGGPEDQEDIDYYYPHFVNYPLTNLVNKTTLLEAFNLIMTQADFVLSCDSWSAWAAIANQVKCGVAAGTTFESGYDAKHLALLGNSSFYCLNWSSQPEESERNLTQWIEENA